MKSRIGASFVGLLFAISFAGCGGTGTTDDALNFYSGAWFGPWTGNAGLESGGFDIVINGSGSVSGTLIGPPSTTPGGVVTGTVQRNGRFTMLVDFPGPDDYVVTGTMTRIGDTINAVYSYTYQGDRNNGSALLGIEAPTS